MVGFFLGHPSYNKRSGSVGLRVDKGRFMKKHQILWVAVLSVGLLASCGGTTSSVISSASPASTSKGGTSSSLPSSSVAPSSSSSSVPVLTQKTVDFYVGSVAMKTSMNLYFADGVND